MCEGTRRAYRAVASVQAGGRRERSHVRAAATECERGGAWSVGTLAGQLWASPLAVVMVSLHLSVSRCPRWENNASQGR